MYSSFTSDLHLSLLRLLVRCLMMSYESVLTWVASYSVLVFATYSVCAMHTSLIIGFAGLGKGTSLQGVCAVQIERLL